MRPVAAGTKLSGDCTSAAGMRFDLPFAMCDEGPGADELKGCANALLEYIAGKARPLAWCVLAVLFLELVILGAGVQIVRTGFGARHQALPQEEPLSGRQLTGVAPGGRQMWGDL